MPGLFSTIFSPDGDSGQRASESYDRIEAGGDAELSPEVHFHNEMSGSYEGIDGSTTEWSRSDEVSAEADVNAAVHAVVATAGSDIVE